MTKPLGAPSEGGGPGALAKDGSIVSGGLQGRRDRVRTCLHVWGTRMWFSHLHFSDISSFLRVGGYCYPRFLTVDVYTVYIYTYVCVLIVYNYIYTHILNID